MIMALVAVNKNGTEVIADNLVSGYYTSKGALVLEGDYFNMNDSNIHIGLRLIIIQMKELKIFPLNYRREPLKG